MPALKKGLSGLEPYEGKLSRTVLRGGSGGNITLLPGASGLNSRVNPNTSAPKMVPGRYDPVYEEGGQDYPLPYVRWTENQNMGHTSSCWQIGQPR